MSNIINLFLAFLALVQFSCGGLFSGKKQVALTGAPILQARFDSATASAQLAWEQSPKKEFIRYIVQRSAGRDFTTIGEISNSADTTFLDKRLAADRLYSYRVLGEFATAEETVRTVTSTTAQGGIHRFVIEWLMPSVPSEFRPTRMVTSGSGVIAAVGIGDGLVVRFDGAGNPLSSLRYTDKPLALLETGTLDGPAIAIDALDNLFVVFNVLSKTGNPNAHWSKFDAEGQLQWTHPLDGLFARHIAVDDDGHAFIESISQLQQFRGSGERIAQYNIPALLVSSLHFWSDHFAALVEPIQLLDDWQAPRLVVYEGVDRNVAAKTIGREPLSPEDRGNGLLVRPTDFAVAEGTDRAFVVNAGRQRIEVFRGGRYLTRWGSEGSAQGQFNFAGTVAVVGDLTSGTLTERPVVAGGIALDAGGYLYVADTFNNRIQKFQP